MSKKNATEQKRIDETYGAHLYFRSLPEPYNNDPFLVKKFESAKAFFKKCKLPKELEERSKFRISSKEFPLAPFKVWW